MISKKRVFEIIQIGNKDDFISKSFDIVIVITIFANLAVTLFETFDESKPYLNITSFIESFTVIVFVIEYLLRVWTANYLYPKVSYWKAKLYFIFSFYGVIDFLTIVPYFLPFIFPTGTVVLRMLMVVRIFRLFRINSQYDAFNVIINVLEEKRNQLASSIFLIGMLMVASSLCMYSLEHDAQPDKFNNAFSGIWWAVSTILTVGYGDITPITTVGKAIAIIISFLGVGIVAIPTGIISAGFVEQYSKQKTLTNVEEENDVHFITIHVNEKHNLLNVLVKDAKLPQGLILVLILREEDVVIPKGDTKILAGDTLVIGAERFINVKGINLKEISIKEEHPWVDKQIKNLDISRLTTIVMIRRKNKTIIPNGQTTIKNGDIISIYSKKRDKAIEELEAKA